MSRYGFFLGLCALVLLSPQAFSQERLFQITQDDSIQYDLILAFDKEGFPDYYYRDVFTPVCKTGDCLPVSIILFWDIIGNYKGYEVPEDSPLTKEDHKPFDASDYEKLDQIYDSCQPSFHSCISTKIFCTI